MQGAGKLNVSVHDVKLIVLQFILLRKSFFLSFSSVVLDRKPDVLNKCKK